jgi:hypothetical protein
MLFVIGGLISISIAGHMNEQYEKDVTTSKDGTLRSNMLQSNWVYVRKYNNYAPKGMPDFDQEQDEWKKIINDVYQDHHLDTTIAQGDDIFPPCLPPCVAPGNDSHLDTIPMGQDTTKYYYCGPVSAADVLWWIDSKVEINSYPDGNTDTCNLVTNYSDVLDDHDSNNVCPLIEDIAVNWSGTALWCTTSVPMLRDGIQAYINEKTDFKYTSSSFTPGQFNINDLYDWIKWGYAVILQLDSVEGGHYVVLNGVNKTAQKIQISDPDLDIQNPTSNHILHNDAGIVSHDIYSLTPGTLHIENYATPQGATIKNAIIVGPTWMVIPTLPIEELDIGVPPQPPTAREQILLNSDAPGDVTAIEIHYYLPEGIDYDGNAEVDGIPQEPIIEGATLKWFIDFLVPGQMVNIEFDIRANNPQSIELERWVRCWGYLQAEDAKLYGDDVGVLNIIDETLPTIENVHHSMTEDSLTIYSEVNDNMIVDQVTTVITDPDQNTDEYEMTKTTGDQYEVELDISDWVPGEYTYHIWAKDLAENEQTSPEYDFTISEELLADADGPYTGTVGEPVQFYGTAVGGAPPYSYEWDFGDGENSYEQNPTHIYTAADTYTVTLTVIDAIDDTDDDTTTAEITEEPNNPPEDLILTGPNTGRPGQELEYTATCTDPEEDQVHYKFDWGDNTYSEWLGPHNSDDPCTAKHAWSRQGTYDIRVKAKDEHDAETDWSDPLSISMPKTKMPSFLLLNWLLNRFPFLEPLLQQFLILQ